MNLYSLNNQVCKSFVMSQEKINTLSQLLYCFNHFFCGRKVYFNHFFCGRKVDSNQGTPTKEGVRCHENENLPVSVGIKVPALALPLNEHRNWAKHITDSSHWNFSPIIRQNVYFQVHVPHTTSSNSFGQWFDLTCLSSKSQSDPFSAIRHCLMLYQVYRTGISIFQQEQV